MNEFNNVSVEELAAVDGGSLFLMASVAFLLANPVITHAAAAVLIANSAK